MADERDTMKTSVDPITLAVALGLLGPAALPVSAPDAVSPIPEAIELQRHDPAELVPESVRRHEDDED